MSKPEALRLAEILEGGSHQFNAEAAAELRRLHALCAELKHLEAVEPYTWYDDSTGETYTAEAIADGVRLAEDLRPLYTAPIAPAIPALSEGDVVNQYVGTFAAKTSSRLPSFDAWEHGARWAYALAAERAGVQIKYPLQELADDAGQIGLEY